MSDWYGWRRGNRSLHIGPLPRRCSIALYTIEGSVMRVHAYFRSEEEARNALETLEVLLAPIAASIPREETSE